MIDRAGLFLADVERSPESLAAVLSTPRPPSASDVGPVRFIGLGSSRFAAETVAAALRVAGRPARVEVASPAPAPPAPGETAYVISASGRTAETVGAARALRGRCPVVAVTNDAGSELAAAADLCLPLAAGTEGGGIACLSYRAALAVLALATGAAAAGDLEEAVAASARVLGDRERWLDRAAGLLDGAEAIDVVAAAGRLGSAEQGALMLREAPRLRAAAWEAGEWLHTAIYTALPGHRLVILGPTPYAESLTDTVGGRGGRVLAIGDAPPPPAARGPDGSVPVPLPIDAANPVRALVEGVVVELLAAELWRRASSESALE